MLPSHQFQGGDHIADSGIEHLIQLHHLHLVVRRHDILYQDIAMVAAHLTQVIEGFFAEDIRGGDQTQGHLFVIDHQ